MVDARCKRCGETFDGSDKGLVYHLRYFHNDLFHRYISKLGAKDLQRLNKALGWDIKYDSMSGKS